MVNSRLWLAIILMVIGITTMSKPSYATTCDRKFENTASIEKKFAVSDVVFLGKTKGFDKGKQVFAVKELYKAPNDKKLRQSEVTVYTDNAGSEKEIGREMIVYGVIDSSGHIRLSHCLQSNFTPQEIIKYERNLAQAPVSPETKAHQGALLVFTGKVFDVMHHWEEKNRKDKSYVHSKIGFEISDVLRNSTNDSSLAVIKQITLYANFCGEKYKAGHEYIVFARPARKRIQPENGRYVYKTVYRTDCAADGPYDLHEIDVLRELKRK